MSRPLARLAAVLVPVVLMLPATAAHAERVVFDDAVGDVVQAVGEEIDQTVPAPDYAGVDVVRTSVAHGASRLRVGVRFRALARDPFQITVVRVRTPDGSFDIWIERIGGKPVASLSRGRKDVECRGLAAQVDLGADTVTASLPTSCLDGPRWVQVGVGAVAADLAAGQPDEAAVHADDAVRVGEIRDRLALGPKVRRG